FEGAVTPSETYEDINEMPRTPYEMEQRERSKMTTDERFLGSVSAFIRRCFEYADPSHPQNQAQNQAQDHVRDKPQKEVDKEVEAKLDAFAIGDDEEEDLLELDEKPKEEAS